MTRTELWFDDSSDEGESLLDLSRSRRRVRDVSNPFEMSSTTFIQNFRLPKEAFMDLLSSTDELLQQCTRAKLNFYNVSRIPGIFDCADGTHIKIVAYKKELLHLYYNRKVFYSINAMMFCDHSTTILYINAKYPGAKHDSLVFNMSALKSHLEQLHQEGLRNTWLLGDAGYALKPCLLTLFRNPEDGSAESIYNTQHAKDKNIIERTIGVLKNGFRCLLQARALHCTPEKAIQIISVCVALHNICIFYKVKISVEELSNEEHDHDIPFAEIEPTTNSEAEEIRNQMLRVL